MLTLDFAMKLLERRFRESSQDWYGKAGRSLLGGMLVTRKADGTYETFYFDLVVESNGDQTAAVAAALVEGLLEALSQLHPERKKVVIVSDNASQFCSYDLLYFLLKRNKRIRTSGKGIIVTNYLYPEP